MPLREGQTGTAPDGTRVIVRNGKIVPLGAPVPAGDVPKTDQEALDRARQEAEQARFQSRAAQQFLDINRETGTGGLRNTVVNLPLVGTVLDVPGIMRANSPNWGAMEAITAGAAPRQRVPGSGATSDFETKMMLAGFPSVDKRGDTNTVIARRLANEDARARARASFLDTWVSTHGSLQGADAAFSKWWTPYAREKGLDTVVAPRKPSAAGPVRVNSPEEAASLPPGTKFITPDGRTKIR